MKELIKNAVILFGITLVAGLFLGFVYEVTAAPRAEQVEKAQQKAYKTVFEKADSFENYEFDAKEMAAYLKEQGVASSVAVIDSIVTAKNKDKEAIGYVITVTDKEGYGGEIQLALGIQMDGTVNGISILSINETAGLGMEAKNASFQKQFKNKKVTSFKYTKAGASAENEIDALSGATITTNAVTNGVNAGIICFGGLEKNGGAK